MIVCVIVSFPMSSIYQIVEIRENDARFGPSAPDNENFGAKARLSERSNVTFWTASRFSWSNFTQHDLITCQTRLRVVFPC